MFLWHFIYLNDEAVLTWAMPMQVIMTACSPFTCLLGRNDCVRGKTVFAVNWPYLNAIMRAYKKLFSRQFFEASFAWWQNIIVIDIEFAKHDRDRNKNLYWDYITSLSRFHLVLLQTFEYQLIKANILLGLTFVIYSLSSSICSSLLALRSFRCSLIHWRR